ncbi:MAG: LysM peptidoglycan-binding domain-containing protein [Phycisphaerae bacterium]|nr:LysM peptidoglycan-binding domain-containing protein [Phycisphaerae bacterium]
MFPRNPDHTKRIRMTMRTFLLLALVVLGALLLPAGCNKPPNQSVEMSTDSDPQYTRDQPMSTDIQPVDEGAGEDSYDAPGVPPLSQAAQGRAYVVQKGDTYWKIAATQLGNGHRWKEIEALNPNVNMNALKVGQTIRIPAK